MIARRNNVSVFVAVGNALYVQQDDEALMNIVMVVWCSVATGYTDGVYECRLKVTERTSQESRDVQYDNVNMGM